MWEKSVERGRPQMEIWRMRIACRIPKATDTHLKCVIIIAFYYKSGYTNAPECYVIQVSKAQSWSRG